MATKVSVVVTVRDEQENIDLLLQSFSNQTLSPFEIVIIDAYSKDKTWDILNTWAKKLKNLKIFKKEGNRSVGRNFGVSIARGKIIAFTDAGCILENNWIEEITKPFKDEKVKIVSGYYKGKANNVFEKCLIPYVLVIPDKIKGKFLPSTRSMAILRSDFLKNGGFNENLDFSEDFEFANRLDRSGYTFHFAKSAIVYWIPRKNINEAFWMFLRFSMSDVYAGIFRLKVKLILIRYYLYFFLIFINYEFALLIIPYILWAIWKNFRYVKKIQALYWLPTLQIISDISIILGTIIGFLSKR